MGLDRLRAEYERIRDLAEEFAGEPGDVAQLVFAHRDVYRDSRGNHAFPLLALHDALWTYDFFEVTGMLGDVIASRGPLERPQKKARLAQVGAVAEALRTAHRDVFIASYTSYHFTKVHGHTEEAAELIRPELLDALNEVHRAVAHKKPLNDARKKHVFTQARRFEHEAIVTEGLTRALSTVESPLVLSLCKRPVLRYAYFPPLARFYFRDFSSEAERLERAGRSYDIAVLRGWDRVTEAMHGYRARLDGLGHVR